MEQEQKNDKKIVPVPKQKVQMSKKKFRIGELAKELKVKKFVIRFWEKEFGFTSDRSKGGQRYYTDKDFKAFKTIKFLLYDQGFTIAGAKIQLEKMLKKQTVNIVKSVEPATKTEEITKIVEKPVPYIPKSFLAQVSVLKEKLLQFKRELDQA